MCDLKRLYLWTFGLLFCVFITIFIIDLIAFLLVIAAVTKMEIKNLDVE